jgi:hypothetical protein
MADRVMVYPGALPQTSDILSTNKFMMTALAYGMRAILGTSTYVDGLVCSPTTPTPDLNVSIGVGSIYAQDQTDASAYSDLGTDSNTIYKQGILNVAQQLTITPPATAGFSQVFLVQAILQNVDAGAQVLSYFNASNPQAPFSGPANAGTSNYTIRQVKCTVALKAGTPATTGTQVTPSPDAGYIGLYAITVANGATQVTSGNIVQLTTAPFIATKLPEVPAAVQSGKWVYAADTSTGGAAQATSASTTTASAVLTFTSVPSWVAAGMKVANLTTPNSITGGQTVLSKTATTVTISANVNATVNSGDQIAFSTNTYVATAAPIPASLVPGLGVRIQFVGTNAGSSTLNLNGLGAIAIKRANGSNVAAGDIIANAVLELVYDGAFWQLQNYYGVGGTTTNTTNTVSVPYGSDSSASSNTITVAPSPAISSLAAGQALIVKLANPITGATTINVSGQAASTVVSQTGQALTYGAGAAGQMLWLLYDGTRWQIINPPLPLQQNLTIYVSASIGNDSYDGSQATVSGTKGPLRNIQTAVNKAWAYPPTLGYSITIQIADGTYTESVVVGPLPGPSLIINGNSGSPANVVLVGNGSNVIGVSGPNVVTAQNFKFQNASTVAAGLAANNGATLTTSNTISGAHGAWVFLANAGGSVNVGSHTFSGNAAYCFAAYRNGNLILSGGAVFTISAAIVVTATAFTVSGGQIEVPMIGTPTFNNPGNVTGNKFIAMLNGVINVQGAGANYFPGTIAGSTPSGGQYSN